ncbi:MAG TPA: CHASE3 domain-containing protein, partial [Caulobacteraceae bacterium]
MTRSGARSIAGAPGVALFFVAVTAGILLFAAWWSIREVGHARTLRGELNASFEARGRLDRYMAMLQDVESSQRRYVLNARPEDRVAFERAALATLRANADLHRAFDGAPGGRAGVRALEGATVRKINHLRSIVEVRAEGGLDAARRVLADGRGFVLMDEVQQRTEALRRTQTRLIQRRVAEDAGRGLRTERLVALLFLFLLVSAGFAYHFARRWWSAREFMHDHMAREADRQRAIFEAALDGIMTFDAKGVVLTANPAAARMFGRAPLDL